MRDFLVSHADLPHGARLWTYGTARRADTDGWTAEQGELTAGAGFASFLLHPAMAQMQAAASMARTSLRHIVDSPGNVS